MAGSNNSPIFGFKHGLNTNPLVEKINPSCHYGMGDEAPPRFENALVMPPQLDKDGRLIQAQRDVRTHGPGRLLILPMSKTSICSSHKHCSYGRKIKVTCTLIKALFSLSFFLYFL